MCAPRPVDEGNRAGLRTLARLLLLSQPGAPVAVGVEVEMQIVSRSDVLRNMSREYPPLQRDSGVSGTVEIRFRVMQSGAVDSASMQVVRSTHPAFAAAALRVAQRLRFRPARVNGRPVPAWATLPFQFGDPRPAVAPPPDD